MMDSLESALRRSAAGAHEHAVIDLLEHGIWLTRRSFRQFVTVTVDETSGCWGRPARASVDWDAVGRALEAGIDVPASHRAILEVARGLATGNPIDLRALVQEFDADDLFAVAICILRAGGYADAVVRWPKAPKYPSNVRVLDTEGHILQEAGAEQPIEWHELGWDWPHDDDADSERDTAG